MPFGPLTPGVYLSGVDQFLAAEEQPEKRCAFLERQLRVIDSHNCALERWTHNGGRGNPPSPFTAFELAQITLELSKRLANEREAARRTIAAE
ncbi:MAG TPA: hypothetical protein VIF40_17945 [Methylosinus sp.]|jgi:hypothetical protein|uniref:hypothetical protein n=1 Tax=Methylosinus sp. TaxID=427 RepID=UPI002F942053